eukprot:3945596-Pyramimonas_sp.AAC.1
MPTSRRVHGGGDGAPQRPAAAVPHAHEGALQIPAARDDKHGPENFERGAGLLFGLSKIGSDGGQIDIVD